MLDTEKKKRGRPVTGSAKSNYENFRTTDETHKMIIEMCEKYGVSKSEVFEKLIQNQYNQMKNGFDTLRFM